ncbi:riboflavin synthase [Roseospira navarrensis]|uniref:Riboflavin synthase n=1 Tax=Roseospira navarrensis TaxID=140058 RepID=A0A7X2D3A3_9PROT|nr:riboflavin synthase [Roseospira navarrensis]MQX35050.1 riboflavin synthase [Roseospira navarrensis]
MFTGIITDLGRVRRLEQTGDTRIEIQTAYDTAGIDLGASIACNGCCLTVIETGPDWFAVQASAETLSKTTLGRWTEGTPVNLERALALGAELGGHIVSGHVDGLATVVERRPEGESTRFVFQVPEALKGYVAGKGSVALDGVSLTVNEVDDRHFGVNIIPHTADVTTFGTLTPGDAVNFEIDMLARYVARLLETRE